MTDAATIESGIQVVVRLRPMSARELKGNALPICTASTEKKEVTVIKGTGARTLRSTFAFDDVFTSFSTQKEVYDQTLAPVVADVLNGFESTVFAYGQTGTGKTHTMEGDIENPTERGVIPRAAFDVFRRLESDASYVDHSVTCSFLEIYNEELGDLLALPGDADGVAAIGEDLGASTVAALKAKQSQLRLVEDPTKKKGLYVMNLTEEVVTRPEDVLAIMKRANKARSHSSHTETGPHTTPFAL
jgi:kinesin family protein 11